MGVDPHVAEFAAAGIILPPKDDLPVLQAEQTMVGDRYPMGVAGQIMQHMLWSAEGRLGIHHPILVKQRAQKCCKVFFRGECFEAPGEHELPGSESTFQSGYELPTEHAAQNFHGKKKVERA